MIASDNVGPDEEEFECGHCGNFIVAEEEEAHGRCAWCVYGHSAMNPQNEYCGADCEDCQLSGYV